MVIRYHLLHFPVCIYYLSEVSTTVIGNNNSAQSLIFGILISSRTKSNPM